MKSHRMLLVLSVFLLFAPGCGRVDNLAKGREAFQEGKYPTAEIYFRKAIQATPRSAEAYYWLGETYLKEGQVAQAYAALFHVAELDPRHKEARLELARLLLAHGDFENAAKRAREALTIDPHSYRATVLLGRALAGAKNAEKAREQFEHAITAFPNRAEAYQAMAALEFDLNNPQEALKYVDRAIKVDKSYPDSYLLEALYFQRTGQLAKAYDVLKSAAASLPNNGTVRIALAEVAQLTGRNDEALALLREMANQGPEALAARERLLLLELDRNDIKAAAQDVSVLEKEGYGNIPIVRYGKARTLMAEGKIVDAHAAFAGLTEVAPNFAPGFYYLGITALALKDYAEALRAFRTAAILAPNSEGERMSYLMLSRVELQQGNFNAALADIEHVLAAGKPGPEPLMIQGDALLGLKRYEAAKDSYQRVLALDPHSALAHQRLGLIALRSGQFVQARQHFDTALKLDPKLIEAVGDLGDTLWFLQGPKAAISFLRDRVQEQPKNPSLHLFLGVFLMRNGDLEAAKDEFQAVLSLKSDPTTPSYLLARIYLQQGHTAQAKETLKRLLSHEPRYLPALFTLAEMSDREGNIDEAIAYYRKVIDVDANFVPALNNLAWDYAQKNENLDAALELAQRARQLAPADPDVADTLGVILTKRGVPGGAVPLFYESIKSRPNSASFHYHLGFALLALGQNDEASTMLRTALKADPKAREAQAARTALLKLAQGNAAPSAR